MTGFGEFVTKTLISAVTTDSPPAIVSRSKFVFAPSGLFVVMSELSGHTGKKFAPYAASAV